MKHKKVYRFQPNYKKNRYLCSKKDCELMKVVAEKLPLQKCY